MDRTDTQKFEITDKINDYWQKRQAWFALNQEYSFQSEIQKNLWSKSAEIFACTANLARNKDDILFKEREINTLDATCISSNR